MLSILIWWAIPAVAVILAAAVLAVSRRIRRAREDVGALHRYQRAREALGRTQHFADQPSNVHARLTRPHSHSHSLQPAERSGLPTTEQ